MGAEHDRRSEIDHGHVGHFADVRHGTRCTGIDLDDVKLVFVNEILDIDKALRAERKGEVCGALDDLIRKDIGQVVRGINGNGDNIGALLRGITREAVQRGQVLAKPGSVHPHHKFNAQVYVLSKDEGGRHTPFFSNYRPQFYFRTTDVTGVIMLPEGVEMVMPGDNVEMIVEFVMWMN